MRVLASILLLAATLAASAQVSMPSLSAPASRKETIHAIARQGELNLWLNQELLAQLGLSLRTGRYAKTRAEWLQLPFRGSSGLEVSTRNGGPPIRFGKGRLGLVRPLFIGRKGRMVRPVKLALAVNPQDSGSVALLEAGGGVWLYGSHPMRAPDPLKNGLRILTMDLRAGPALANFLGRDDALDLPIAEATLSAPLSWIDIPADTHAKSCPTPNWPGTPGYVADVQLYAMESIDYLRCRHSDGSGGCDGTGPDDGEVVFAPTVVLKNSSAANAADIPWYTKFTSPSPPYNNDQHPFLVWNLYRIDADGNLDQIARSGLKHAFATSNDDCVDTACGSVTYMNILGRGCQDTYNTGSNDYYGFLGPRSEVVPAQGKWGRCGSIYDPNCDGAMNMPPNNSYAYRLVARESDIAANNNPNARYFMDAWYTVRDDADLFNTMGFRQMAPTYNGSLWSAGALGAYHSGAVMDYWYTDPGIASYRRQLTALETPEGQAKVAVHVTREIDGRYRYDYTVMNFNFARAVTQGSEPNLHVVRSRGFSGVGIDLLNDAAAAMPAFFDGDKNADNNWTVQNATGAILWNAAANPTLDWGRLLRVRFHSTAAPARGQLHLQVAEPDTPAAYDVNTWVPDADRIFDGTFE